MRLNKSVFNPIPLIVELAGVGLPLTSENLTHLKYIFSKGGIEAENDNEVITLLSMLITHYNLFKFDNSNEYTILRMANG